MYNHEQYKAKHRKLNTNPDLVDKEKYCPGCSKTKTAEHFNKALFRRGGLSSYCKLCNRQEYKEREVKLKEAIYNKLGHTCCRCSFSDKRALQIDHINGGGNQEHKQLKNAFSFYKKVLEDTTNAYQILCANCNWIKRHENKEEPTYDKKPKTFIAIVGKTIPRPEIQLD